MTDERLAAIRQRWGEYEYGVLDGAAVVPEDRMAELERSLAADAGVLLADVAALRRTAEAREAIVAAALALKDVYDRMPDDPNDDEPDKHDEWIEQVGRVREALFTTLLLATTGAGAGGEGAGLLGE